MFEKRLYKKDSKGRMRKWCISGGYGTILQSYGLMGGKYSYKSTKVKGKNIGRSNETTPHEQSKLEAESKYLKKKDEGYFDTIEQAEKEEVILPMLAQSFDKHGSKVDYNMAFIQPKLDGMRALVIFTNGICKIISRQGKDINTMKHIEKSFEQGCNEDGVYDGELYCHGESFQDQISWIKKYQEGLSEKICFHIYDMISCDPRYERILQAQYNLIETNDNHIRFVPCIKIFNEEDIEKINLINVKKGYEGSMIRWGETGYETGKRSYKLLKVKNFIDEVFEIINIIPMEKYPNQGKIICRMGLGEEEDKEFVATPKMSFEKRKELLENKYKYIGKKAEIRFFEYTDGGIPRFPIFIGIRYDK